MFRLKIIQTVLSLLDIYLIQKITVVPFREFVQSRAYDLSKVADILTDSNPENNAQLLQLWNEVKEDVKDDGIDVAIEIIRNRVKNVALREFIIALLLDEKNLTIDQLNVLSSGQLLKANN